MKTRARRRASAAVAVYRTKEEYVTDYVREGILCGDIAREQITTPSAAVAALAGGPELGVAGRLLE